MTRRILAVVASCLLSATAAGQSGSSAVELPRTPIGTALAEWLAAYNSSDSVQLRAFYRKYALERSMDAVLQRRRVTGGYDLVGIDKARPRLLEFVAKERSTGALVFGLAELNTEDQPLGLRQWTLQAVPAGGSIADFKIDAATRARVIAGAIAYLDSNYVFADVAMKMGAAVKARLERGEYDDVSNGISFAQLLTEHFREISHDLHLRVGFFAAALPDSPGGPVPFVAADQRQQILSQHCWFRTSEVQPGNIGYLKFDQFWSPDFCGEIASEALNKLADTDALIVDLRDNGGGDPAMVAYVASYLFDQRTHLNDIWTRRTNQTRESWTRDVPGKKFGGRKPVYLLTSARTFSGAEEFSYDLQSLKRVTIIGEQTGGGAHPTNGFRIDAHFEIRVPFARAINPITKTNWEGTGVTPDVRVPASQALDTAQALITRRRAGRAHRPSAAVTHTTGVADWSELNRAQRAGRRQTGEEVFRAERF